MKSRTNDLLHLRPEIASAEVNEQTTSDERFQNETLRPVISLQNDLFLAVFKNYIHKHKGAFYELAPDRKMIFIENAIQKDIKFRNSLKGMVIGQFTLDEYERYIQNSSALNKRMMNLVIERLKDQVQLFEPYQVA
ncbi:MAG: glyoxalase [Flavobacteriaceae bacterium]|nr:glyoxalase [Flavobacteriaceae bacterium]